MPQMSPMSWLLILLLFMFCVMIVMNSFKTLNTKAQMKKTFQKKQKSLMW